MSANLQKYQVDFSSFLNRDQNGNALAWSLDQFRDKPVYQQVLQAFVSEANELYEAICHLANSRTIFYGTGVWLDGIGRIVGQTREVTPVDLPDSFFYWDDSVSGTRPPGVTGSAHFFDDHNQWLNGASVNANSVPTDNDFRDEIIRRIYQNMNQFSSVSEIEAAISEVLGISVRVAQTGVRSIRIDVPSGTPDWIIYYITGKSFDTTIGTYNRWWFPYPACISVTTGVY